MANDYLYKDENGRNDVPVKPKYREPRSYTSDPNERAQGYLYNQSSNEQTGSRRSDSRSEDVSSNGRKPIPVEAGNALREESDKRKRNTKNLVDKGIEKAGQALQFIWDMASRATESQMRQNQMELERQGVETGWDLGPAGELSEQVSETGAQMGKVLGNSAVSGYIGRYGDTLKGVKDVAQMVGGKEWADNQQLLNALYDMGSEVSDWSDEYAQRAAEGLDEVPEELSLIAERGSGILQNTAANKAGADNPLTMMAGMLLGGKAAKVVSLTSMGLSALNNGKERAMSRGLDEDKAQIVGLASALNEVVQETLFDAVGVVSDKVIGAYGDAGTKAFRSLNDRYTEWVAKNISSESGQLLAHYVGEVGDEVLQEVLGTFIDTGIDYYAYGDNPLENLAGDLGQTVVDTTVSTILLTLLQGDFNASQQATILQEYRDTLENSDLTEEQKQAIKNGAARSISNITGIDAQQISDYLEQQLAVADTLTNEDVERIAAAEAPTPEQQAILDANDEQIASQQRAIDAAVEDVMSSPNPGVVDFQIITQPTDTAEAQAVKAQQAQTTEMLKQAIEQTAMEQQQRNSEVLPASPEGMNAQFTAPVENTAEQQNMQAQTQGNVVYRYVDENGNRQDVRAYTGRLRRHQLAAREIADNLGRNVVFVESLPANSAAFYDPSSDTIYISARHNATQALFFHELTHNVAEKTGRGAVWHEFLDYAYEAAKSALGDGWQKYYDDIRADYAEKYSRASGAEFEDMLKEEIAAEYVQYHLFKDKSAVQALYNRSGNMFQRVWQKLKDFIDSMIGNRDASLIRAEQMFSQVYDEAMQNIKAGEVMAPAQEALFSREYNAQMAEAAEKKNNKKNFGHVDDETMRIANMQCEQVKELMDREDIDAALPVDTIDGNNGNNTKFDNGSYGVSEENTTVCVRQVCNDNVCDAVAERIGRPLNVMESLWVSQQFMGYADKGACLYCYELMDRWAKSEFINRYLADRDAIIEDLRNGMDPDKAYKKFRRGRKSTKAKYAKKTGELLHLGMEERFEMFRKIASGEIERAVTAADMASQRTIDQTLDAHPELAEQIQDVMYYAQSASWAKKKVGYTAYDGHILKWTKNQINKLNSTFGLRFYSFSDFSPAFILENMQMVRDASVQGLKGLAYTKETDFVKIFAPTGMNINMSIFGYTNERGEVVEDAMQGAKWDEVKAMREKFPNVGAVFVATSDAQVEWALSQDWIDVVIPFHTVRTGKNVANALGYKIFTGVQEDRKTADWNKDTDLSAIDPALHNNDKQLYLDLLQQNHLTPRFESWIDNPGYMKLVNETRRSYGDTEAMQPIYDISEVEEMLNRFVAKGGYENEAYGSTRFPLDRAAQRIADDFVKNMDQIEELVRRTPEFKKIVEEYDENVSLDDIDIEPGPRFARSVTPEMAADYQTAYEEDDEETAQRLVDEAASKSGYTTRLYSGTDHFGFTQIDTSVNGGDGHSFWAVSSPSVAATYTVGKRRRVGEGYAVGSEAYYERLENAKSEIEDEVYEFCNLVGKYFSEWAIGPGGEVDVLNAVMVANPEVGYGDGVYDELDHLLWWAYDNYGDDFKEQYGDQGFDEWRDESDAANELYYAIGNIEALRTKYDKIESGEDVGGIYDLFGNTDGFFEYDGNGSDWNRLTPTDDMRREPPERAAYGLQTWGDKYEWRTRDIVDWAYNHGYPGVHFKNIVDLGQYGVQREAADVYAFLDANAQVKSADPFTFDDDGNLIPLQKRFEPANNDIRWARGLDKVEYGVKYSELVNEGDKELYNKAKEGDTKAAADLIEKYVTDDNVAAIAKFGEETYLLPVVGRTGTSRNAIPINLARYLSRQTGQRVFEGVYQTDTLNRRSLKEEERLAMPDVRFDMADESGYNQVAGQRFVLIDDNTSYGSTFRGLRNFVEEHGGNVVGAYALTVGGDNSSYIDTTDATWEELEKEGLDNAERVAREHGFTGEFSRRGLGERRAQSLLKLLKTTDKRGGERTPRVGEEDGRRVYGVLGERTPGNADTQSAVSKDDASNPDAFSDAQNSENRRFARASTVDEISPEEEQRRRTNMRATLNEMADSYDGNRGEFRTPSRVGWNTLSRASIYDTAEKNILNVLDGDKLREYYGYEAESEIESLHNARERVSTPEGLAKEERGLPHKFWNGEDTDTAMFILSQKLDEARESGDYKAVRKWAKMIQRRGTEAGQRIQAFAKYTATPEGMLVKAGRVLEEATKFWQERHPKQTELVKRLVNELMDGFEGVDWKWNTNLNIEDNEVYRRIHDIVKRLARENGIKISNPADAAKQIAELVMKEKGDERREQLLDSLMNLAANGYIGLSDEEMDKVYDLFEEASEYAPTSKEAFELESQAYQIFADHISSSWSDKWNAWRYLAMLGNTRTHVKNILGNVMFGGVTQIKDALAGIIEEATGVKDRTKTANLAWRNTARGKALYKAAMSDADYIYTILRGKSKYNVEQSIEGEKRIFKTDWLEKVRKANDFALEAEDWWALQRAYARSLANYMYVNGLTEADLKQDSEMANRARANAVKEAQKATFRNANAFSRALSQFSDNLNNSDNAAVRLLGKAVEGVMPFKNTPANIVARGVEYSPAGLISTISKAIDNKKTGYTTGAEVADSLSSSLTGTGIMALGVFLAATGLLTGGDDDDDRVQQWRESTGQQNYAFNIGDRSYTLDWAAPAAMPLMVGAELYKALEGKGIDANGIISAIASAANPAVEMTMLQGVKNILDSASYGENSLSAIGYEALTSYATQAMPTLAGQIARSVDKTRRTAAPNSTGTKGDLEYLWNKQRTKTPGLSMTVEPYTDVWGREQENTGGSFFGRLLYNTLSPGYASKTEMTDADKYVESVYNATNDSKALPEKPSRKVNGERLDAKTYTKYAKQTGQTALTLVNDLSKVQGLTDSQKLDMLNSIYKYSREKAQVNLGIASDSVKQSYAKYENLEKSGASVLSYWLADARYGNGNGSLTQAEIYGSGLSEEEKRLLWNAMDWSTTYDKYASRNK